MTTSTANKPLLRPAGWARWHHQHAIIDTFEKVDVARKAMEEAAHELVKLIDQDAEWRQRWNEFQAAGGMTADELCRWLVNGKQIRKVIQRKAHLRAIDVDDTT